MAETTNKNIDQNVPGIDRDTFRSYSVAEKNKILKLLKNRVETLQNKTEQLEMEIDALVQTASDPTAFLDYALNCSDKAVLILKDYIANECSGNEKELIETRKIRSRKLKEIEEKIQANKAYTYKILKNIINSMDRLEEEIPSSILNKEIQSDRIGLNVTKNTTEPEESRFDKLIKEIENGINLPIKSKIDETLKKQPAPLQPKIPDIIENRPVQKKEPVSDIKITDKKEITAADVKKVIEGFWDDSPVDFSKKTELKDNSRIKDLKVSSDTDSGTDLIDMEVEIHKDDSGRNEEEVPVESHIKVQEQKPAAENVKTETVNNPKPKGSDTTKLKYAYVLGKIAGEDLFDKSGKLIIAKNEVITEIVVDKAESEGRLVELVVNMKLQQDSD